MQVKLAEAKPTPQGCTCMLYVNEMAYLSALLPGQASTVPPSPAFQFTIFESPFIFLATFAPFI